MILRSYWERPPQNGAAASGDAAWIQTAVVVQTVFYERFDLHTYIHTINDDLQKSVWSATNMFFKIKNI